MSIVGNLYLYKTNNGGPTDIPATVLVVGETKNNIWTNRLDDFNTRHDFKHSKAYFLEDIELVAEGVWEGDKVLVIDRIFRAESGWIVELLK